jgi:hypothetical protein
VVRDPYARWCGRRGAVRLLPIPIMCRKEIDMTALRTFRIDGWNLENKETEFIVKVENDEGHLEGTYDMTGDGIYYYRPGSQIMTPNENENTRETYDGYISFEALKTIFEDFSKIGWNRDLHDISVTRNGNQISLELIEAEE